VAYENICRLDFTRRLPTYRALVSCETYFAPDALASRAFPELVGEFSGLNIFLIICDILLAIAVVAVYFNRNLSLSIDWEDPVIFFGHQLLITNTCLKKTF